MDFLEFISRNKLGRLTDFWNIYLRDSSFVALSLSLIRFLLISILKDKMSSGSKESKTKENKNVKFDPSSRVRDIRRNQIKMVLDRGFPISDEEDDFLKRDLEDDDNGFIADDEEIVGDLTITDDTVGYEIFYGKKNQNYGRGYKKEDNTEFLFYHFLKAAPGSKTEWNVNKQPIIDIMGKYSNYAYPEGIRITVILMGLSITPGAKSELLQLIKEIPENISFDWFFYNEILINPIEYVYAVKHTLLTQTEMEKELPLLFSNNSTVTRDFIASMKSFVGDPVIRWLGGRAPGTDPLDKDYYRVERMSVLLKRPISDYRVVRKTESSIEST